MPRVQYTQPIWEISTGGQWFHLAALYDQAGRRVPPDADVRRLASVTIIDRFPTSSLRIGAAEIGNRGQPFRATSWFAT